MVGVKTGLDYQGVKVCMEMRGIPKKQQRELFAELQMMEAVTLREWSNQR